MFQPRSLTISLLAICVAVGRVARLIHTVPIYARCNVCTNPCYCFVRHACCAANAAVATHSPTLVLLTRHLLRGRLLLCRCACGSVTPDHVTRIVFAGCVVLGCSELAASPASDCAIMPCARTHSLIILGVVAIRANHIAIYAMLCAPTN